jgi:hypothetical protein
MSDKNKPAKAAVPVDQSGVPLRQCEKHEQCPLCYNGMGGVGDPNGQYKKWNDANKFRQYYRCDRCGHTWNANMKRVKEVLSIEYKTVDDIQER